MLSAYLAASVAIALQTPVAPPSGLSSETFERKVTVTVEGHYLLYLPEDYASSPGKRFPLMLFLHGAGETGTDLNRVAFHGPPKEVAQGRKFPFIIVSPQTPRYGWDPVTLTGLLDEVEKRYRVDKNREYLTGLSMGGFGTWQLAASTPKRFAAIAPICGGAETSLSDKVKDIPIWAFHGAKDPVVSISQEQPLIDQLKRIGADVTYTVFPEGQHDVWTQVYAGTELYDWFLKHKRRGRR